MNTYQHLYIHLPFCDVICHYCDFYTARNKEADHALLFKAISAHLEKEKDNLAKPLKSIYFGGGTPSASPPSLMEQFLKTLGPYIDSQTEISLEANPNDLSASNLRAWRGAGISRLSIGVQSLRDEFLKKLGRTHSAEQAIQGIKAAQDLFKIVSADLIYAVPDQGVEMPAQDAKALIEAGVTHLSAYHLTLEPEHFLFRKLPDQGFAWDQVSALNQQVSELGFEQYEVSNFAPPGKESVHNRAYWMGRPYLALGPSGHSFDGQFLRFQNIPDWREYAKRVQSGYSPVEFKEELNPKERLLERLFTGLRTREGLSLEDLKAKFGVDLATSHEAFLSRLQKDGLADLANDNLRLSFKGRMLADSIVEKLNSQA